ncbi:MAG TPA: hypothetical protein VM470_06705 [Acidimicrobiia bacterium]|nr:hypothetical protein [Acidimicrobiia bacterium]
MATFLIGSCSSTPHGPLLILEANGGVSAVGLDGESLSLEAGGAGVQSLQPTWSPDGRLAVWTAIDAAANEFSIRMGDSDNQRKIEAPTAPFFYYWNPDAETVAFLGNAPGQEGVALGIIDVASGQANLIDGGAPYFFDWDPVGDRLAIHVATRVLAFVDLKGNRTEIPIATGQFQTPEFLPDGRLLIVSGGPPQVLATVSEEGTLTALTEVTGISMFSADPTGERVAFTDSGSGQALGELQVYDFESDGGVTVDAGPVAGFEWDPSGRRLLYFTVDVEGRQLVPMVWTGAESVDFPGFAPSVQFLTQYLPFWDQYTRSLSLWSPEGDAFVIPDSEGQVLVQYLDQPEPENIGPGVFASWSR